MALPEIRLLETAIVLAEELHFSRAAERLRVDQSTVSKRTDELESQLGFRLFDRNHQIVEMTEPGRKFVEEARLALLHVERAIQSGRTAQEAAGGNDSSCIRVRVRRGREVLQCFGSFSGADGKRGVAGYGASVSGG